MVYCLIDCLQAETINRLLKRQSRGRGRGRNALSTAEDRSTAGAGGGDADAEDGVEDGGTATPILPTMYRWTSTTKAPAAEGEEPRMVLSFSVPVSALPPAREDAAQPSEAMDVDSKPVAPQSVPYCDVQGCDSVRRYRLVKDSARGACGMEHLKVLETQMA